MENPRLRTKDSPCVVSFHPQPTAIFFKTTSSFIELSSLIQIIFKFPFLYLNMFPLVCFALLLFLTVVQAIDPSHYSLGSNLIQKPDFSAPRVNRDVSRYGNIARWNCISQCQLINIGNLCSARSLACSNNYTQGADLDVLSSFETVSQGVSISTAGQYLLTVEWMAPASSPIGKSFEILSNGAVVSNITCSTNQYTNQVAYAVLNLTGGSQEVGFRMSGTIPDGDGILLTGVYLQPAILIYQNTTNTTNSSATPATNSTSNTTTTNATSTPGSWNSTANGTGNATSNSTWNSTTANSTLNTTSTNTTYSTTNATANTTTNTTTNTTNSTSSNATTNTPAKSTAVATLESLGGVVFNNITKGVNSLPGNRVLFYGFSSFMITFDRLQFYFYHHQNLTQESETLLSSINKMADEKGELMQTLLTNCQAGVCQSYIGFYEHLVQSLNYKQNYTDSFFLGKNSNGAGFFANNLDFFFFELPLSILIYVVLVMVFRLLFNYRLSKYIRKYSFSGMLLLIIYEGNVEQFSFYFFNECKTLFSLNFSHKLANVAIIFFFFFLIVFCVGGLLWFTFNYRKLVKYFLEDSQEATMKAVTLESLERSVYPLLFGAIHSLLIDNLAHQTIVLALLQTSYLVVKVYTLRSSVPEYKFKVSMLIVASIFRLLFIATFYLYQTQGMPFIINLVHYDLVWFYLICWAVELVHDLIFFFFQIAQAVRSSCSKDTQKPQKQKNKDRERPKSKKLRKKLEPSQSKKKAKPAQSKSKGKPKKPEAVPKPAEKSKSKPKGRISKDQPDTSKSNKKDKIKKAEKDSGLYKVTKVIATGLYGEHLTPEIIIKSPIKK